MMMTHLLASLLLLSSSWPAASASALEEKDSYTFAVVPKRINSPYWQVVRSGCETRAKRLSITTGKNITCLFTGPAEGGPETEADQADIVNQLIDDGTIDGMALAVVEAPSAEVLIDKSVSNNIHVVTFDSDAVNSSRLAYIGTDNAAFGQELGGVLLQMQPAGGTYAIIAAGSPNIQLRVEGVRSALKGSEWIELTDDSGEHPASPTDCLGDATFAAEQMFAIAEAHPNLGAIIPVGAWPMLNESEWKRFVDEYPNVLTVVSDALQQQIDLMNMGYANALVGQLPFEMGSIAIDKLYEIRKSQEAGSELPFQNQIFSTSFVNVIKIPQDLPPLLKDMNYIGNWRFLGYILCGVICPLSAGFFIFTFLFRNNTIIRKSQPLFLYFICFGIFTMGSALIPLTVDDEHFDQQGCDIACMSVPWLLSIGFVTTLTSLFCKSWRVNLIFHNPQRFKRVKITANNVLVPFAVLMTANVIVLLCWTLLAPLKFERHAASGTDNWNRVYKGYVGVCVGGNSQQYGGSGGEGVSSLPFVIIIGVLNVGTLLIANIQSYQARTIHVEYSESRYVAMAMVIMLVALIMGVPIIALFQNEKPQASYIVCSILIFVTCISILLLIYVPKISYMKSIGEDHRTSRTADHGNAYSSAMHFTLPQAQTSPFGSECLTKPPILPISEEKSEQKPELTPEHGDLSCSFTTNTTTATATTP